MKKVFSVLCALMVLSIGAFAQGPQGPRRGADNGWRERVRAEKVAFLTEEIDLTESEAQVFWPIYNEIQKAQRDGFEAVKNAYDAMAKGVEEKKGSIIVGMKNVLLKAPEGPPRREGRPLLRGRGEVPPPADRPPRERQLPQPSHERRTAAAVEGTRRTDEGTVPQLDRPRPEEGKLVPGDVD